MSSFSSYDESKHARSSDGKFAAKSTSESDVDLSGSADVDYDEITWASGDDLDSFVHSPDVSVRSCAALSPSLTQDQARYLADPDEQPTCVRLNLAQSASPYAGPAVESDPSATVRAFASKHWSSTGQRDASAQRVASMLNL